MATEVIREKQGHKNEQIGTVVSTKMAKTVVIEVTRRVPHPLYKRIVTKRKKFYAHDEQETAKMGDFVRIFESRPRSALKRWELGEILRRAPQVTTDHPAVTESADTSKRKTIKAKSVGKKSAR